MVTILLTNGEDRILYHMYRGVLCFYSKEFKRMLDDPAKEGDGIIYEIRNCCWEKFEMFYNWVNTGIASITTEDAGPVSVSNRREQAVNLYEFATFYSIRALKNCAVDIYYDCYLKNGEMRSSEIDAIYDYTPKSCTMRLLVVDLMLQNYRFDDRGNNDLPSAFLLDIMEASYDRKMVVGDPRASLYAPVVNGRELSTEPDFCQYYHDHSTSE